MPNFRDNKARVREVLMQDDWQHALLSLGLAPIPLANACLACLPQGSPLSERAAKIIGQEIGALGEDMRFQEQARMFVRRLMWHMNEESGNIGWGIPETFGEVLAHSSSLAAQFHRVLISYIVNTGSDDNYCDLPLLRRSCYAAVARLAQAQPEFAAVALPPLQHGAEHDPDETCRDLARSLVSSLPPLATEASA